MRKIRLDDSCLNHLTNIPVGFTRKSSYIRRFREITYQNMMYFADRGCVRTWRNLYCYGTDATSSAMLWSVTTRTLQQQSRRVENKILPVPDVPWPTCLSCWEVCGDCSCISSVPLSASPACSFPPHTSTTTTTRTGTITRSSATAEIARDALKHSRSSVVVAIDAAYMTSNSNLTSIFNYFWDITSSLHIHTLPLFQVELDKDNWE